MSFFDQNAAMFGAGIGVMPFLLKNLFGSSSKPDTNSLAKPTVTPTATQQAAAKPAAAAPGQPTSGQPTPAMLQQAQKLFPGATQEQLPAYIQANPEMFQPGGNPYQADTKSLDLGSMLGKLGNAIGGSGGSTGGGGLGALGGSGQTQFAPAPPPIQQPSGGGPNPQLIQAMMPNQQMLSMSMPTGGIGTPLGPAASNPLLAMLRSRLGVM